LLSELGEVVAPDRGEMDFTAPESVARLLSETQPDLIVNAAAYTDVERAETETVLAHAVNTEAPAIIGAYAHRSGVPMLHYSTDYVFDGALQTPYDESAAPNPLNVYGKTKLGGESALKISGSCAVILRTGWLYSARRNNFLKTMLRIAQSKDTIDVVADQIGTPTSAHHLAVASVAIARRLLRASTDDVRSKLASVYHVSARGETSWHGFAREIFAQADVTGLVERKVVVNAIGSDEFPTKAVRPRYSVLDCRMAAETFGIALPPWRDGCREVVAELSRVASEP
jgi:dTDP-4-dehydrorhamnose reductase